jgi:hypothetical protein
MNHMKTFARTTLIVIVFLALLKYGAIIGQVLDATDYLLTSNLDGTYQVCDLGEWVDNIVRHIDYAYADEAQDIFYQEHDCYE